ncbi:Protein SSUH2 [Liparis tanakae]|uniref:Protein SSUH2 n=1 Tax=Liparis tanakae TaxID=230148 RepID=A0A4Z2FXR0_9TELE|nr:Protein SSUH2 [Liparis tanakae]
MVCDGAGSKNDANCSSCNATGKKSCPTCEARGTQDCTTCKGKKQMLAYIKLTVEWTNNVEDYVVQHTSGMKVDLKEVTGKELFKNNQSLLYPLTGFPNPDISEASERLIRDHQSKYAQNSRILQQPIGLLRC